MTHPTVALWNFLGSKFFCFVFSVRFHTKCAFHNKDLCNSEYSNAQKWLFLTIFHIILHMCVQISGKNGTFLPLETAKSTFRPVRII